MNQERRFFGTPKKNKKEAENNGRSRRVIEKCGFTFVKTGVYHSKQMDRDFADREYILFNPGMKK